MNGTKWGLGCAFVALLGGLYFTQAHAQAPQAGPVPAAKSPTDQAATEKSVLAEVSNQAKPENAPADFCQCVGQTDSGSVARIERALAAPLHSSGFDYTDTPLTEVVNQLQDEYGIPIQLDSPALQDAGIAPDQAVNIALHNISLRSALQLMLKRLQMKYIIQDEVLLITSPEEAEHHLRICVYDARKVMSDTSDTKMESLSETIMACVASDTWSENGGGAAEIRALPPGLLVITQTQDVHQEIRDLLATIRKMTQSRPPETARAQ